MRAPLMEAEQNRSIRIDDLTKVSMARRGRILPVDGTASGSEAARML
jgi:hypothetical protein